MKLSRFFLAIAALVFLFALTVSSATAGSMGNGAAQRMKLVVDSIDATTGSIVLKSQVDQSTHPYTIDANTHITVNMAKGTIDQIKVGQKIDNDRAVGTVLTFLMLRDAPPAK